MDHGQFPDGLGICSDPDRTLISLFKKHTYLSSYSDLRVKEGGDPEVLLCHSEGQVVVTGNVVRIKSVEL